MDDKATSDLREQLKKLQEEMRQLIQNAQNVIARSAALDRKIGELKLPPKKG